jgi:hypothetical protein
MTAAKAWDAIKEAAADEDFVGLKEGVANYVQAVPTAVTYVDLETAFRGQNIGLYLIALENANMLDSLTNMDLQGSKYYFSTII